MRALRLPDLTAPPRVALPPPDPALLDAIRAEAEAEGHARGLAEGVAEGMARQDAAQQAEVARALAAIEAALGAAAEAGRQAATEAAAELARLFLATLEAALPGATERAGGDLVPRLLLPLLPAIADRPEARLRVAPALRDAVAAAMPPAGPEVEADPALPPGDARVEWRDGAWIVSREARWAAVRGALAAAGIIIEEERA
jgi:flagellar biosynthesis/type III secretory pathway protein FliH